MEIYTCKVDLLGSWNNVTVSWGNRMVCCCSVVTGVSFARVFAAAAFLAESGESSQTALPFSSYVPTAHSHI